MNINALAKEIANQLKTAWTSTDRLPVDTGATANTVIIQDGTTPANRIAVNATGQTGVSNQPSGFATETTLTNTRTDLNARLGATNDTPATGVNAVASISSLIRLLASQLGITPTSGNASGAVREQLRAIHDNLGIINSTSLVNGSVTQQLRAINDALVSLGAINAAPLANGSITQQLRLLNDNLTPFIEFQIPTATITTTLSAIHTIDCRRFRRLAIEFRNTGTTALNNFQIQVRVNSSSTIWNPITFADTDFTTNTAIQSNNEVLIVRQHNISTGTGTIRALPAAASSWLRLDVTDIEAIRFMASVAATTTTIAGAGYIRSI